MSISAFVNSDNGIIEIGNGCISRGFSVLDGILMPLFLKNKRMESEKELGFSKGSEEFVLYFKSGFSKRTVNCSSLTVKSAEIKHLGREVRLVFTFEPVEIKRDSVTVRLQYALKDDEFFIKKQLFLSCETVGKTVLESVDAESFSLENGSFVFSCPENKTAFISSYHARLGQPVYFDSFFSGYEFPLCDNRESGGKITLTRYCGKRLSEITEDADGFADFPSVVGAAEGCDYNEIRRAFFDYVSFFARPLRFRTQYNSWYDHMLDIDEEKIEKSFSEIERHLTDNGIEPLDSYVVDDGWNDYKGSFWSFNEKFPNGLEKIAENCKFYSSSVGLWLGLRGGYNYNREFAKRIQRAGKGHCNKQSRDICVADKNYIENVCDFLRENCEKYNINALKLDGFLLKGCKSKRHNHARGGEHDMYCYTDAWESWLNALENLRNEREKAGKTLSLNFTCYSVPSPWMLRYADSLWLQNSDDIGFSGSGCDADRMLSYRDSRYYNLFNERKLQLPSAYLYNHEPIYAHRAYIKMTDSQFRKYLYTLSLRGTAFWEMYLSYDMMSEEKWKILSDVLKFTRKNFDILKHSSLIGGSPDKNEVYGYCAFAAEHGFVLLRNPSGEDREFKLCLDEAIGYKQSYGELTAYTLLPFANSVSPHNAAYSQTLTLKIPPEEVILLEFSKQKSEKPSLIYAKRISRDTAELRFSERMIFSSDSFSLNGQSLSFEKQADGRGVILNVPEEINDEKIRIDVSSVYYVSLSGSLTLGSFNGFVLGENEAIEGDYTLSCTLSSVESDSLLLSRGNRLALSTTGGRLQLNSAGVKLRGSTDITKLGEVRVTAVREKNSLLRLYINGKPEVSYFGKNSNLSDIPAGETRLGSAVKEYTILNRALAIDEV